jgi:D-sedoheptulose 7-phosphate isomerase
MTPAKYITASVNALWAAHNDPAFAQFIDDAATLIVERLVAGGKLLVCGNGGSATDAMHIAGEFVGSFVDRKRPGLAAIALAADTAIITAVSNDFGVERVFSRQVAALGQRGDVLLAISTSGNSENVLRAVEQAALDGLHVVGMTGAGGGRLAGAIADCDGLCLLAPAEETPLVQQLHQVAYHSLAGLVEFRMFPQ